MNRKIAAADVKLKRAYQPPAPEDGRRILIDRLWPRGVSKQAAAIDQWAKELAPSTELREWFGHEPQRWPEFRRRYAAELRQCQPQLRALRAQAREHGVTLVYAAHDEAHNNAVVVRRLLLGRTP
ncbi:MAG: DUF488 domain-containing protein [Burkholderiaceae bacterium]